MEKIIVIGTGKDSEVFLYNYRNTYEVLLFADDSPRRNSFRGKSVVTLDSILFRLDGTYKVVIATPIEEYIDISRRLQQNNLIEFDDYIYYKAIGKKIAMFYGNCQCHDLGFYMSNISEFSNEYWIYPTSTIYQYDTWYVPENVYRNLDLLVYQNVKKETNGLLFSTDYIVGLMKAEAIAVRMPNLYKKGFGWYPQSYVIRIPLLREAEINFVVCSHNQDSFIRKMYKEGISEEKICNMILRDEIWSRKEILDKFDEFMEKIKAEDEVSDIKIYDYIVNNYRDIPIFCDAGHVTNDVYREYIMQLCSMIGLELSTNINGVLDLLIHHQVVPIYGCVARTLGLTYFSEYQLVKEDTYCLTDAPLTLLEYVKQYVYMCVNNRNV